MTIKELSNLGYETYEIAKTSAEAIQTFMQEDHKFSRFVENRAAKTKKGSGGAMLDIKTMLELAADYINKNGMYEEYLKANKTKTTSKPKPVVKKEPVKKKDIFDLEF